MLKELTRIRRKEYDVTIFQTPGFREKKGFQQVYRLNVEGSTHEECLDSVFRRFNVLDRIPVDFNGRFISTGDILYIDEGRRGQYYYQLKPGGWEEINRIHIR
ncbi:YodL domain-containing protein [Bacillus sp. J33]|uniref:YodL domain-containing protein n=1 Tax=Bacillus sp. J33 TaxID=935836 RepID=UPI00047A538D|nr:YodL domain-containing protein [Bacillus sp. J33]